MADDKKKFVITDNEFDDIESTTKKVVIADNEFDDIDDSPKSTAPSKTGGESGARITPSTSTLPSAGSELGSWTQTTKPVVNQGVVAKPTAKQTFVPPSTSWIETANPLKESKPITASQTKGAERTFPISSDTYKRMQAKGENVFEKDGKFYQTKSNIPTDFKIRDVKEQATEPPVLNKVGKYTVENLKNDQIADYDKSIKQYHVPKIAEAQAKKKEIEAAVQAAGGLDKIQEGAKKQILSDWQAADETEKISTADIANYQSLIDKHNTTPAETSWGEYVTGGLASLQAATSQAILPTISLGSKIIVNAFGGTVPEDNVVDNAINYYDEVSKKYPLPNTLLGKVEGSVVSAIPLIYTLGLVKNPSGNYISHFKNLATVMGTQEGAVRFNEAYKQSTGNMVESYKGLAEGFVQGVGNAAKLELEMGVGKRILSPMISKPISNVINKVKPKAVNTETVKNLADRTGDALGVGLVFSGTSAFETALEKGQIDSDEALAQFFTGIAFEAPAIFKAAKKVSEDVADGKKVDSDSEDILNEKSLESGLNLFFQSENADIEKAANTNISVEDLKQKALEAGLKVQEPNELNKKISLLYAQIGLQNLANLKRIAELAKNSPMALNEFIDKTVSNIEQADAMKQKVIDVFKMLDPKEREVTKLSNEISEIEIAIEEATKSLISQDAATRVRAELAIQELSKLKESKTEELRNLIMATPEATAGETIKTKTNEKANEDGEQKRGKDGEEDVTKSVQSEGEVGGNEVDLQEKQVLGTEGAVTAAPNEEIEKLRAKEQEELNAAIPNADKYKTDGKVDRNKLTDPKDIKAFDEIYDKYNKLITASKTEQTPTALSDVKGKTKEPLKINGQEIFYHASNTKRQGRLKPSSAPQFGTGIYFATSKDLAKSEFGENITEVKLALDNPVYTNTKEWSKVEKLALEKANEKKERDEDGGIIDEEYDVYEINSDFISDAAKELGYDAIIDKNSSQYENEIIVLDESKIVYEEDFKAETKQNITNEKSSQKTDQEASTEGSMLEEPRDGGTQDEGGQESTELRTEEKEVEPTQAKTTEEATPKDKVWSKTKAYNNLGKVERKSAYGSKLRAEIMSEAAALGYTVKPTKQGKYILVDERGKEIRNVGTPRSKDEIQEEKRIKERRSRARRELPISIKHSIAQDIANGVKFDRQSLMDVAGLKDSDIPFWMTDAKGKGITLENYSIRFEEKGGFLVEDDMNFQSDVAYAIGDFAFKRGQSSALEYIESIQEKLENGGLTDVEMKEQAAEYQAELDEANFDYFAEYLSNLSDAEAQQLADQLREAEAQENQLIINEILNENGSENKGETEQGKQKTDTKASDTKGKSETITALEEELSNIEKEIAKKQAAMQKLTKDEQADMFAGAKIQMFDNAEILKNLTNEVKDLRQKANEVKAKIETQLEKEANPVVEQPKNQLDIEEEAKKEAAKEKLTDPKNASDLAKTYRNKFKFSPQQSVWAARLFDAKAAFMSKVLGISKEEYYSQYWFGVNEEKGGLSQEGGFQTRDGKPIGFNYDTDKVARERFDFSNLKKIGSGSDRDVYDLGDGKVLKVAKTARGLNQNIYEGDFYLGVVPKVFERGLNYVVAENTPRIKTSDIVQTFDVDGNEIGTSTAGQMLKELQQFSQKDFDNKVSKLQDVLAKYGLQDVTSYEVLWNDFTAQRNWGYKDGVAYHSDGGTFGGVNMISSYKGKTNMSDPEFREIYQESKKLKKQFGDTDKARMYQDRKGSWTKDAARMKRIINMYEKADSTTAVHEMLGHDYLDRIIEASATNKESEADLRTIAEEYIKGTKSKEKVEDVIKALKEFNVENNKTAKGTSVHEWFATQAEQYFATEKDVKRETPQQSKMAKIFEAFRAHLAELYDIMNKTLIAPSEPMKQVFRKVFGEENFNKAEEIRAENVEAINNLNAAALEGNKKAGGLKSLADKLKEKGLGQSEFAQDIWDAASELIANGKAKRYNVTDALKEMFPAIEGDIESMRKVLQEIGTTGKLRQGAENILANPNISDEVKEKVAKMSEYTPETLKKVGLSTNEVIDYYIGEYGEVAGLEKIKSLLDKGEFDGYTEKVAIQQSLIGMYNKLAKFGATEQIRKEALNNAVDVAEQYINQGTSFGRAINAYKLLGSLTTEGRLVWAKRQTNKYVKPAHEALKENIRDLKAELKDAYKQVDYFFEQTLGREETEGQYKEAIAQYQAEIDALKARKPREPKPSKTAYKGVKATREFKESDLANFAKDILAGGLFQDMETMTAPQKLAYGIMEKKPINISEFAKAFGRYLGKKIDPKELESLYVQTRDLLITKDLAFADGLSTNEQLRADLDGLEVANKAKIEELERKKAEAEAKIAAKAKKGEKKEHSEELADFVIKDAKKAMNGSIAKQKTYLDEILKALKEKTADVINKGKKDKIQTAKVSEVEAIKFALDAINNGGADANMWNDAVEQVKAKIKGDNTLSQQDKDDLNLYLNDYTTFLYDNLLSENKIFKVIREKLIQSGYGNGTLVNWKQIIEGADGDVNVMREIIQKLVKNQLKDYDNVQVEKVLDAIVYKYDQEINKQRKKIADKYIEKELGDKKSTKKKTAVVQGKIGKLLVENRLGILKDGNNDMLNELAAAKGLKSMSEKDWKRAAELAENVENSADGILKNRAIEEMTAFIASKQPLSFMNTASSLRFAGLLGRATTVAVNLISGAIEGGLLAGGRAIRGNTSFIKESFKGVSKGGFKDILFGGGINQASKTSVEVNSSGMPYFRALEYYEGKGKKIIKSGKYVGRVLDATDSVFQEMFGSGYDRVYLEKQIKLENPNATKAEIDQMVNDALSKTKYDEFYAQALQDVIKSGQKPTPANVKRRTYEILRESQVSQMAIDLSDLESREKTFKSEFKENRGLATLFGSMLASSSNVSRKVVEPVAEYMFKLSGYNQKQAAELAKKIGDVIPNKIMPFTRGVSNVIEKALEKDMVYGLTKSLIVNLGVNKMPTTTMEEKMAKARAEEKVKDLATTAIFTNILIYGVGSLLYAASKAWDDDEEKEGRNPEKTGVYPIQSQKTSIGSTSSAKERGTPENTLVLFGQKIPLKWLGSTGAELSLTANINKALTKDSKSSGAEKVANAALDISESYMQQSFMMSQNDKQSVVALLRDENVNWDKVEDYMINDMISYGGSYVLWSGFVNQSLQGARYLSGDKSYQEAKTLSEKLQKQVGLAGITYDNKKPNYMGRPLEATEVNREGIQGLLGMFSKSYKSPIESWAENVGYKESLVSRGSKQLATIKSESFVSPSNEQYDDFTDNTRKLIGKGIEFAYDKRNEVIVPLDADGGLEVNKKTGKAYTADEYTNKLLNDMSNAIEGYKRTELVNRLDVNKYDRDEYLSKLKDYYYKLEDAMKEFYIKGSLSTKESKEEFGRKVDSILPPPPKE